MIQDLLKGFSFDKMGSYQVVTDTHKSGLIYFTCWNEAHGGVKISFADLKRLMEHINAEHLAVYKINLVDNYKGEWEIVVEYRLY